MHAVLYTKQLEPITIVDIPMYLWEKLAKGELIGLPVPVYPSTIIEEPEHLACQPTIETVLIYGLLIHIMGESSLMLFTRDEEKALMLQSEFLPGQHKDVQRREQNSFVKGFGQGFLDALRNFTA